MSNTLTIDDYTPDKVRDLVATTPASGKKCSLGAIAAVATLGSLLFGYDTGVIAGALPYMYMPGNAGGLHMTTFEEGWVGGLLCIGAAAGAFFGGRLSDRYGRRHNITLLAIVFLFGAIGCAIAPNIWVLYLARVILGFAVGGASATVPVFLGETAPKRLRGVLVATDQMMIVFGQFLAFSMNAVIARWQGGPTVTLTGDAVDASGHVLGQAGTSVAWETVSAAVNIAEVTSAPMEDAITLNVVSGGISAIGSAVGLWLVARFARRHVGMYQELGITISLAALSAVFAIFISPYLDADGNISGAPNFAPWLVLGIVCLFVFIKQSGTVTWVLVSEIYPAAVRGSALGIAVGTLWLANALVSVIFPPLMATSVAQVRTRSSRPSTSSPSSSTGRLSPRRSSTRWRSWS